MKNQDFSDKKDIRPTDFEILQLIEKTKKEYENYYEINSNLTLIHHTESVEDYNRTMDHPLTIIFKSDQ